MIILYIALGWLVLGIVANAVLIVMDPEPERISPRRRRLRALLRGSMQGLVVYVIWGLR